VQLPPPTPRPREGSGRLAAARTAAAAAGNPSTQPQLPLPDGGTHPHLPVPSWKTPGQALGQLGKGQDYAQTPQHSTHGHFLGGGKRPGLPSHARGPQHPTAEAPPHRSPPGSGGARSRSLSFSGGRWRCAVTQRSPTPSLPRADPDPASAPPATASSTRTICWSHMRGAGRQRTTGGDRGPQGELPVKMTSTGTEEGRGAHFQQDLQPRLSHPSPPPTAHWCPSACPPVCPSSAPHLVTLFVVRVFFLLGEQLPLLAAQHHPLGAGHVFHVGHQLCAVQGVAIPATHRGTLRQGQPALLMSPLRSWLGAKSPPGPPSCPLACTGQ